jgi:hypothetical protein
LKALEKLHFSSISTTETIKTVDCIKIINPAPAP